MCKKASPKKMSQYQGIVLIDEKTNRVEIIIFPFAEGIPNASAYVNKRRCYTPTDVFSYINLNPNKSQNPVFSE